MLITMRLIRTIAPDLQNYEIDRLALLELLQKQTDGSAQDPTAKVDTESELEKDPAYCCAVCLHNVTQASQAFEVLGQHEYQFTNPHGYQFLIGCFCEASGCLNTGDWISQYSWFAGYLWRYSLCSACHNHLGWQFRSEQDSFYGLITTRLVYPEKMH